MAIVIDIDMPNFCDSCPLSTTDHSFGTVDCNLLGRAVRNISFKDRLLDSPYENIEKPEDCPLKEVTLRIDDVGE